jgi:hypothetical protein
MRNLIIVLLMAISTVLVAQANAQECMKEAWVKEYADTQGGGFRWIPQHLSNPDPEMAILLAKADALAAFINKCGIVMPVKLAFNEICLEEPSLFGKNVFTAHVRLAYTDADCNLSREMSKPEVPVEVKRKYTSREMYSIAVVVRKNGWR